jgi:hypothetical protein
VGSLHRAAAARPADRRDRQGRHRVSERPPAGARPDELRRLRNGERIEAKERPIVVITSNNEKELPDAFLRRCFFHYIKFPDRETMQAIIDVHFPGIQKTLVTKAMDIFYEVREVPGLKKKPSTSELLDWLKLLLNEDMPLDVLQKQGPDQGDPAAARRAAQERAGRHAVRTAGLHGAPRVPDVSIWADRAEASILVNAPRYLGTIGQDKRRWSPLTLWPNARNAGMSLVYPLEGKGLKATGLAMVRHGTWLIKLRLSSARHDPAQVEARMTSLLRALALPAPAGKQSPVYQIKPCQTSLSTAKATQFGHDPIEATVPALLVPQGEPAPATKPYCREETGLGLSAVMFFKALAPAPASLSSTSCAPPGSRPASRST